MAEILQAHNVSKKYGEHILWENANFSVQSGEIVGLVGNNGTGKTTLMKAMLGLAPLSSGHFEYDSKRDYAHNPHIMKEIGYLLEIPLYPYLSAHDTLRYLSLYDGQKLSDDQIGEVLRSVSLENTKKKVGKFSFGMTQKLRLAISLMYKRKFLILDEPTVGLDPESVAEFLAIVQKMAKERDIAILFSSHQLETIENVCDRVLYISDRQIRESDTIMKKRHIITLTSALAQEHYEKLAQTIADIEWDNGSVIYCNKTEDITRFLNAVYSYGYQVKTMEEETKIEEGIYQGEQK